MQYFSYTSEDIYTYQNLEELKKIIEIDEIGLTRIHEQEQYVSYEINREKCIRLSDLVYFISFNLVRIHLGQLLVLVKSLAQKVQQLQLVKIDHEYLDCNRIWLKFNNQNEAFNCKYSILNYTIHFTGYQCPNYEDLNEKEIERVSQSKKILIIIKYIIDNCFDNIILTQPKDDVKKTIIEPIINEINNKQLDQLIYKIDDTLKKYQYDKQKQIISVDEDIDTINNKRHEGKIKYNLDIKKIMQTTSQMEKTPSNAYKLEYCLYSSLPQIVKQLDNDEGYQRIQYEGNNIKTTIEQIYFDLQNKIQNYIEKQVKQAIIEQIQFNSQFFKFQYDEQDITKIITKVICKHAIIQYFYNTYTYIFKYTFKLNIDNQDTYEFNANKLYQAMEKAIDKIIPLETKQYFILETTNKILELINDLI
ncbi:unnamed protein product [Paramecium primaurelia]|uniref:Uncharacterized protein n=1 Tax=Paramecium primaurelia TaxID=5886 RepID=A0A8S1QEG9_PARPR|nr:unnamed protein product [Paramecium primaurelia]